MFISSVSFLKPGALPLGHSEILDECFRHGLPPNMAQLRSGQSVRGGNRTNDIVPVELRNITSTIINYNPVFYLHFWDFLAL